jgi:hypothetical protein
MARAGAHEPGAGATQVQAAEGDGHFQFQLRTGDVGLSCEPLAIAASQEVCEQELEIVS